MSTLDVTASFAYNMKCANNTKLDGATTTGCIKMNSDTSNLVFLLRSDASSFTGSTTGIRKTTRAADTPAANVQSLNNARSKHSLVYSKMGCGTASLSKSDRKKMASGNVQCQVPACHLTCTKKEIRSINSLVHSR